MLKQTAENSGRGVIPCHVGEREGAHRLVELRALGVTLEEPRDVALAGRDDDEVAVGGVALEVVDGGLVEDELAAARGEVLHPAGELDALVDRLGDAVEPGAPVDRLRAGDLRVRDRERDPLDGRARVVPEVDPERPLVVERGREHALAGRDAPVVDLLGRAVGDDRHVVAVLHEPDAELEPGLAAADDRDLRHGFAPLGNDVGERREGLSSLHQLGNRGHGALGAHRRVAAVDRPLGAGDEARVVGEQERDDVRDLLRVADTAEQVERRRDAVGLGAVVARQLDHHLRPRPARARPR